MSAYSFEPTFVQSSLVNDVDTDQSTATPSSSTPPSSEPWSHAGSLASVICHVAHLERSLRSDTDTVFFDSDSEVLGRKVDVGRGASFRVQRAEWRKKDAATQAAVETRWGKYVALKSVQHTRDDWRDVLLEVRALLHPQLRYHPNMVQLVGLGWGGSAGDAVFPQLVMQFSEIGSLLHLQTHCDALPFALKKKLCYDVGRGLSVLHACGIVHGDLTHANVLVFRSKVSTPGLPLTAKLSDFGGAVMDMAARERFALRMATWPFSAPEQGAWLSAEVLKQTDVYSFGLFVWRTVVDCANILGVFGLDGHMTAAAQQTVALLKQTPAFLTGAKNSVRAYAAANAMRGGALAMVLEALECTVQPDPTKRSLTRAQCLLIGMR